MYIYSTYSPEVIQDIGRVIFAVQFNTVYNSNIVTFGQQAEPEQSGAHERPEGVKER